MTHTRFALTVPRENAAGLTVDRRLWERLRGALEARFGQVTEITAERHEVGAAERYTVFTFDAPFSACANPSAYLETLAEWVAEKWQREIEFTATEIERVRIQP